MASILASGTANPPDCFDQDDYPDFYFRVTKSEHMTQLKDKFKRICIHIPGADHELTKLLGLERSVKRFMMYQQGCFTAAQALRPFQRPC
ncbi:hypothetical protein NC652_000422 [Populus alba x Populus x berolinensis]|nr:hypothetical protein NC652_000422 [Populus alba x Populus x berolinensis]